MILLCTTPGLYVKTSVQKIVTTTTTVITAIISSAYHKMYDADQLTVKFIQDNLVRTMMWVTTECYVSPVEAHKLCLVVGRVVREISEAASQIIQVNWGDGAGRCKDNLGQG